jgi:protein CpxP
MNQKHTLRKTIALGLAALGMAASNGVQAQSAATPAPEGRHGHALSQEQRQAKWAEMRAKRQAKLHDALKLTPAQEPAWATFTAAMQPAARPAPGAHADWKSLPAPQRMERAIERSKQRSAMMETRLAALKQFYAALTPEQQKLFDQAGARHHQHKCMRMEHHS